MVFVSHATPATSTKPTVSEIAKQVGRKRAAFIEAPG
jgi:hypothetical protein